MQLVALRGTAVSATAAGPVALPAGTAKQSEIIVTFTLPKVAATLSVTVGDGKPPPPPPPPPAPGKGVHVGLLEPATDLPGGNDYNVPSQRATTT